MRLDNAALFVGTEMRPCTLHDDVISTPEGLKNILQDPRLRHKYMIDADLKSHTVVELSKKGGDLDETDLSFLVEKAGKRRIDFLLFRHIDGLVCYLHPSKSEILFILCPPVGPIEPKPI